MSSSFDNNPNPSSLNVTNVILETATAATAATATAAPNKPISISKDAIKRLLKDIGEMIKTPLNDQGIYYKHSETDILEGWALIIGPKDSLYRDGYYFFKFEFPTDYPHAPPLLHYYTNDGITRFHPNFYKGGKVCIDILNTWRGEKWSGCQTISSVLLTLVSIMDNEPILNEPGITKKNPDFFNYHNLVEYRNYSFAIYELVYSIEHFRKYIPIKEKEHSDYFYSVMKAHYILNKDSIMKKLQENKELALHPENVHSSLYLFGFKIDYANLILLFKKLTEKLTI
jgi:ubiquitin-conjugating enzyme E2 Z